MSDEKSKSMNTLVAKLLFLVGGMFGFGFLLVPLYDVFCEVTGINGKYEAGAYEAVDVIVDTSRTVKVQFVATNNDKMNWRFSPSDTTLGVHPGEISETSFIASNPADFAMTGQAVPSIMPSRAVPYFHKTECFCFTQQVLEAGETINMPLRFIVDQDLPKDIKTITLSYTLFDVTAQVALNN